MRIKRLLLENIASIESADIDFENGLVDGITGAPASIFIISGDTGAGKSVILDGIAMALYKTTPRIAGTSNIGNNYFMDMGGEKISVTNISQYTRLGISEKDKSYSEVLFEGNDGKEYRARLTLGMLRGNTNKQGTRPLKYRNPEWKLTMPDGSERTGVNEIQSVIAETVGLTFDQFSRMAMLAQGQFAAFLTGDRKNREIILEQLTNTSIFSVYGKAVESLFKNAKSQKTSAESFLEGVKKNPLSKIDMTALTSEIETMNNKRDTLKKALDEHREKLGLVNTLEQNGKKKADEEQNKQKLLVTQHNDDFQKMKALIEDWDNTNKERQHLVQLKSAVVKKMEAEEQLSRLKSHFEELSSDLGYQSQNIKNQEDINYQLQLWLEERKDHEPLYLKEGEWCLKMQNLNDDLGKLKHYSDDLKTEQSKSAAILNKVEECDRALDEANKAVEAKQKDINELMEKRKALNPSETNAKMTQAQNRKGQLEKLSQKLGNLAELQSKAQQLQKDCEADTKRLESLEQDLKKWEEDYETKKAADEDAKQRLTTMKMSVSDTLTELRKRMHNEGTKQCPLCGQNIDRILSEEAFQKTLTPLETEQKKTAEALEIAERQRDTAKSNYDKASAKLGLMKKTLSEQENQITEEQRKSTSEAQAVGLDAEKPLDTQIAAALESVESEISRLKTAQDEAERLQNGISTLLEEKKPLDKTKSEAEASKQNAQNVVDKNKRAIEDLQKQVAELTQTIEKLETDIKAALSAFYPDWRNYIEATCDQLKQEAKVYLDKKSQFEKTQIRLNSINEKLKSIRETRSRIVADLSSWNVQTEPAEKPFHDRDKLWTDLLTKVSKLLNSIAENKKAISENQAELDVFFEHSGKTQTELESLVAQEEQVATARTEVSNLNAALKSCNDAIASAQKLIDETMTKLGIVEANDIPEKHALEKEINVLEEDWKLQVEQIAQKEKQLSDYKDFEKSQKDAEQKLEAATKVYVKWEKLNKYFGGMKFRTLVQTYILRPLLNNANIYLEQITDRYRLTCSEDNEQLSILVLDRYNKNQLRSVTVLSGGERFMISLALSLALSSLGRPDLNVNILFIDEGFGTLDKASLESVMVTLERLQEIAGQSNRRVGIISHREDLEERIPVKIMVEKCGEGRSHVRIKNTL